MRVKFIWPNLDCPLGLSMGRRIFPGALKAAGHDTKILHVSEWLDYPFNVPRIVGDVRDHGSDLIAMSAGANHYPETGQPRSQGKPACTAYPSRNRKSGG